MERTNKELQEEELWNELEEYFEDRADCDYQGDPLSPVPNKEMILLNTLAKLKQLIKKEKPCV